MKQNQQYLYYNTVSEPGDDKVSLLVFYM